MSVTNRLKDDLNRLITNRKQATPLPARPTADRVLETRGTGLPSTPAQRAGTPITYTEVITVYSYIIITESGAFEKPSGWPASSGTAGLSVGDPYYEQKRVHASFYLTDTLALVGNYFLIKLETPLTGGLVNNIASVPTDITLFLDYVLMPQGNNLITAKVRELGF